MCIKLGNGMLGDLRVPFWLSRVATLEMENALRVKIGIGSVYADVYEEMKLKVT